MLDPSPATADRRPDHDPGPVTDRTAPPDGAHEDLAWWRHAVVYEIYLRSFADADGDGTGDIAGLRSRLPYLAALGIDAIWITPWYASPNADGGYDVSDYRAIDPRYGDLDDAEALIADAHAHGMRVIVDMVPNHTSEAHPWFQEALASPPGHPSRDRYEIHPGRGPRGDRPPSSWESVFGGPAWTRLDDGEWYLHLFAAEQPDLNWDNQEVREEFADIFRFWLDRGADGLRVDVAHGLVKDKSFPDIDEDARLLQADVGDEHPFWDRDGVHDIIRSWRTIVDAYPDRMMVAEAWVKPHRLVRYLRPDEYHQSFNFALVEAEWDVEEWREIIAGSMATATRTQTSPTWTLSNHDVMRHVTRLGLPVARDWRDWLVEGPSDALDVAAGHRRALAASLCLLALPGSTYLYQGEELGLPEVWDLPPEVMDDPVWFRSGGKEKGRDGCRVPLPWTRGGRSLGFGPGPAWLPQPPSFAELSVEAQQGRPDSTLELYRTAIALRRTHAPADDELEWLDVDPTALAFRRSNGLVSVTTFGPQPVTLPDGEVLLATRPVGADRMLPADATAWLRT